jgi:hypothetical protein
MIKYKLLCENNHKFDGWFPNIDEFERQQKKDLLICPLCETKKVDRAMMSPSIGKKTNKKKKTNDYSDQITNDTMIPAVQAKNILRKIRKHIINEFDNVGNKFIKEYRKFEKGERDDKFYGTPSQGEVKKLLEEGIDLFHVPEIKEDA